MKNPAIAKSLIKEAKNRYRFAKSIKLSLENANFIVENCYDVIRELIEAHMRLNGYKSHSHREIVAYFAELNYSRSRMLFLDELRKIRNKIKYKGKQNELEYAKSVVEFVDEIYPELLEDLDKLMN